MLEGNNELSGMISVDGVVWKSAAPIIPKLMENESKCESSSPVHWVDSAVYKRCWTAANGEVLQAEEEEPGIPCDGYAVSLIRGELGIAGHVP